MLRRLQKDSRFRRFNSSPGISWDVVMIYVRFALSLRNVEDLLFERGKRHLPGDGLMTVGFVWTMVRCEYQAPSDQSEYGSIADQPLSAGGIAKRSVRYQDCL